jgi:uncharacterized iron-regulated protein
MRGVAACIVGFIASVTSGVACEADIVRISDDANEKVATFADVKRDLSHGSVLALGERHGVVAHPKAAACLINSLSAERPIALVVEHFSSDQQSTIDLYRAAHPEAVDGLGVATKWWQSGWPAWSIYKPLFDSAWVSKSSVIAADLPRSSQGIGEASLVNVISLTGVNLVSAWSDAMNSAHCGQLDPVSAIGLAKKQISRDVAMAEKVVSASERGETLPIFYAGRSHVQHDRSVPKILSILHKTQTVAISLQEVTVRGVPINRARAIADARGRYNYVWFIGEANEPDVCASLKKADLGKEVLSKTGRAQ